MLTSRVYLTLSRRRKFYMLQIFAKTIDRKFLTIHSANLYLFFVVVVVVVFFFVLFFFFFFFCFLFFVCLFFFVFFFCLFVFVFVFFFFFVFFFLFFFKKINKNSHYLRNRIVKVISELLKAI